MLNRLQLWLIGKKPQGRYSTYLVQVIPWLVVGFWLFLAVIAFSVNWAMGIILLAWAILCGLYLWYLDVKRGYVDVIQQNYLRNRAERIAKLQEGIKKTNE